MKPLALAAALLAAAPCAAADDLVSVVTVILEDGQSGTFTRGFSFPQPMNPPWANIGVYRGEPIVIRIHRPPPGDVNGDGRIGLEDAIYVLQITSGHRPQPQGDNP